MIMLEQANSIDDILRNIPDMITLPPNIYIV